MPRFIAAALLALVLAPVGLRAQDNPVVASLKTVHEIPKGFLLQTAETLSDDVYGFQPTEDVRTAGQILAHVADAQYMFCSAVAGEDSPSDEFGGGSAARDTQVATGPAEGDGGGPPKGASSASVRPPATGAPEPPEAEALPLLPLLLRAFRSWLAGLFRRR